MERGYFEELNSVQRKAVEDYAGPSLIIAGAGSGKTRVLTCRIAHLLEEGIAPGQILALTFTNKAAREMKERIGLLVGEERAYRLWMGTFHSIFARILRKEAELIGFPPYFTIYDKSDSRSALKACIKELELDEKVYMVSEVQSRISKAKNNLLNAAAYSMDRAIAASDSATRKTAIASIYNLYTQKCFHSGAMDFDDLLLYANVLFRDFPEVLERYSARFSHILVDEYQDTNFAQYLIVKKLAQGHRNVCVVGDDAQSIYAFRGARIENILNFMNDFPEAKEYRLEQNYRSTQTIVNAANCVIQNNTGQLKKECFSKGTIGEKIEVIKVLTDQEEAYIVVASIVNRQYSAHASYDDFAILYRTNAQSRVFEESLRKRNIPYKIYGGFSFYERGEIKDMLAYLRLAVNCKDDEAFKRVINVPARGIGDTTLQRLQLAAHSHQTSLWEQIESGDLASFGLKPAAENRLKEFVTMMNEVAVNQYNANAYDFAMEVAVRSGYMEEIKNDNTMEGKGRLENIEEFFNSIKAFIGGGHIMEASFDTDTLVEEEELPHVTVHSFIEKVALITDLEEEKEKSEPKVSLMTMHSAKGLEFGYVYIAGMEENLFPSQMSGFSLKELEEERRLFYVAMTRAKSALTLSYAQTRFRWGTVTRNLPSRFLEEIDPCWLKKSFGSKTSAQYGSKSSARFGSQTSSLNGSQSSARFGSKTSATYGTQPSSPNRSQSSSTFGSNTSSPFASESPSPNRSQSFAPNGSNISTPQAFQPSTSGAGHLERWCEFSASDLMQLKIGLRIEHERFGCGTIVNMEGKNIADLKAMVHFDEAGTKKLLLKYARIKILD